MTMTDPISDMLTRIRNANVAMHDEVAMPSSRQKLALADLLKNEGYISSFSEIDNGDRPGRTLTIEMKYSPDRDRVISGLKRVSKPGLRIYRRRDEIPRVQGHEILLERLFETAHSRSPPPATPVDFTNCPAVVSSRPAADRKRSAVLPRRPA